MEEQPDTPRSQVLEVKPATGDGQQGDGRMTKKSRVIVELLGDVVNDIYSDSPDVELMLIDFETEGMDVDDLRHLSGPHYDDEDAHVAIYEPGDRGDFDALEGSRAGATGTIL